MKQLPPLGIESPAIEAIGLDSEVARHRDWLPRGDVLDGRIAALFFPSLANLMVVPLTGAVDTFWVGRMGDALALAGQGAANQLVQAFTFVASFVPTVTVPMVAKAFARGDLDEARDRACDSLWIACLFGLFATAILVGLPHFAILLVLPGDALSAPFAASYLRLRSLSMIPVVASGVAFAAFRGCLDVVTPLKVALTSNLVNLLLDPILIFSCGMGVAGAAVATVVSEVFAAGVYLALLLRRRLASWARLVRAPDVSSIMPLLRGSSAVLVRNVAWNAIMLLRARSACSMDPTGVTAAAYTICLQIYMIGMALLYAIQTCGSVLVDSALASSRAEARRVADRVMAWGVALGMVVCAMQLAALPVLVPLFTPLDSVRQAVYGPATVAALVQLANGLSYASEGVAMGAGQWSALTRTTLMGLVIFAIGLQVSTNLGLGLIAAHMSVWAALGLNNAVIAFGLITHNYRSATSPLARVKGAG